ncbi:MAG: iron-sulfur cluster assembly scaffold protein [Sulfurimonadaceae bacterium]|jgi:nitrogen fixation NifU-like protein|nr:iron-sulfur cluster assembly scaffold protein [Sulfurimonadaceae bacterium]
MQAIELPKGMNPEVLMHLMDPKNYGKLDHASGVGVAVDEKTGEYVIFYTLLDNEIIKDVRFATNGCQDTVVLGSMFTEMIKNNTPAFAQKAIGKMNAKLMGSSAQQQICADMVLSSFVASMINYENLQEGKTEEMHVLKMKESCEVEENEQ